MQIEIVIRALIDVSDARNRFLAEGDEAEHEALTEEIKQKLEARHVSIEEINET